MTVDDPEFQGITAAPGRPVIRKGTIVDVPACVAMIGHFINDPDLPYHGVLRFMPSAVTQLAEQVMEAGIVFIAEVGGRPIGLIAAFPMREPISKQTQVDELIWWVEKDYRQGTIGPRLLKALENWARQKQLSLCRMIAPVGTDVGRYYERAGYTPIETSYVKRLT